MSSKTNTDPCTNSPELNGDFNQNLNTHSDPSPDPNHCSHPSPGPDQGLDPRPDSVLDPDPNLGPGPDLRTHPINGRKKKKHNRTFRTKLDYKRLKQRRKDTVRNNSQHVVNLSRYQLTEEEMSILTKGLNFIPTPTDSPDYAKSLARFKRTHRLRYFFRNVTSREEGRQTHPFRLPSSWTPPTASPEIELYLSKTSELIKVLPTRTIRSNVSVSERRAIINLKKNKDIVIKNADKGSSVVVENREDYIAEGLKHLSDQSIYQNIPTDPTQELAKTINGYVIKLKNKGYIDRHTKDFLTLQLPVRTQLLYFLKKLHKTPHAVRPIVSGCGSPTEKLSAFIEHYLKPLVPKTDSYIRDSKSLISFLETLVLPSDVFLVTVDVSALYLNIPHKDGIAASLHHLYTLNPQKDEVPFPPRVAEDILSFILKHNYFIFADKPFKQVQGTAMGTKMAPQYANLFMDVLEREFMTSQPLKPMVWRRYIDDVFMIWQHGEDELEDYMNKLNNFRPTIKFTYTKSTSSVEFLDCLIYKGPRFLQSGILDLKPFFKGTNTFQYLHFKSCHPVSIFRAVVKGETVRVLRACTDENTFRNIKNKLLHHFVARGYPGSLVKKAFSEVPFEGRSVLLEESAAHSTRICASNSAQNSPTPPDNRGEIISFIVKYNPRVYKRDLYSALRSELDFPRVRLVFTKNKTVSNYVVRAGVGSEAGAVPLASPTQPFRLALFSMASNSSLPCMKQLCGCCSFMSTKCNIISTSNGKHFKLPAGTDCSTSNVVYCIECKLCDSRSQYVGQTRRTLRARMGGHRAAFSAKKKNLPLYDHFRRRGHTLDSAIVSVLEVTDRLLERESHWIHALDTRLPRGLNSIYHN